MITTSTLRTLVIGNLWPGQPLVWRGAQPADDLDWSLDITSDLADIGDSIASFEVTLSPSGPDDAALVDAWSVGNVVSMEIAGGLLGRCYQALITVQTLSDRKFEYSVLMPIGSYLGPTPGPTPGQAGPALTWTSGAIVIGASFANVGIAFDQAINALFGGRYDQTVSMRAALAQRAGKRWGCLFCRALSFLVQRDHCADQFIPGSSTPATFIRAGIEFGAAGIGAWLGLREVARLI